MINQLLHAILKRVVYNAEKVRQDTREAIRAGNLIIYVYARIK